jgi:hypothetical protein
MVGCGGPETIRVDLLRVSGTVTLDGEPLADAIVVFESADGSFSFSPTDSRGAYDLIFDSNHRGITSGRKTVRISMNRRLRGLNSHDEGGLEDQAGGAFEAQPPERIPERYNTRSELTADVSASTRQFDFALSSEPESPESQLNHEQAHSS